MYMYIDVAPSAYMCNLHKNNYRADNLIYICVCTHADT